MIVPAVVAGLVLVFGVGYAITTWVLTQVVERAAWPITGWRKRLTRDNIQRLSAAGGVLAAALMILSLSVVPRLWFPMLWIGLTVLGFLCAVLLFLLLA